VTDLGPLLSRLADLSRSSGLAIEAIDGRFSHAELLGRAGAVADLLRGGRPSIEGERVAILLEPSGAWVACFFGVQLAGGVVVPLSPLHPREEIAYFLATSGARRVLLDQAHEDRRGWFEDAEVIATGPLLAGPATGASPPGPATLPPGSVISPPAASLTWAPARADSPALMLFTSGTTGKPKGAVLTHGNLATQAGLLGEAWGVRSEDVLLHALPLHHMHGVCIALLTTLLAGAGARLLARFEAPVVWEALPACTVWMAVPTMYHRLLQAFDAADEATRARWTEGARRLRLATSGSAALPVSLAERWRELTGEIPLERFGMTEIGVGLSNPLVGRREPGSVGRPLRTVEARVVREDGGEAAAGEAGELLIRGPSVFAGYFGREEATRAAFREGWFVTGDTAAVSVDGTVKILGRTSVDILKSGGYKLSALEIEEALRRHPAVSEVAVVGLPDEAWGERVVAAVVLVGGMTQQVTSGELRAFCKEHLAAYKVPREAIFLEQLPRNALGKVVKPELIRQLAGRT
jgi:malonyl-CoA/methylmalonyl-CoA synthetase